MLLLQILVFKFPSRFCIFSSWLKYFAALVTGQNNMLILLKISTQAASNDTSNFKLQGEDFGS
jgi:hypothetical protein